MKDTFLCTIILTLTSATKCLTKKGCFWICLVLFISHSPHPLLRGRTELHQLMTLKYVFALVFYSLHFPASNVGPESQTGFSCRPVIQWLSTDVHHAAACWFQVDLLLCCLFVFRRGCFVSRLCHVAAFNDHQPQTCQTGFELAEGRIND